MRTRGLDHYVYLKPNSRGRQYDAMLTQLLQQFCQQKKRTQPHQLRQEDGEHACNSDEQQKWKTTVTIKRACMQTVAHMCKPIIDKTNYSM